MNSTYTRHERMFCHACNNQWLKAQHGIVCPRCRSEFCEELENNDNPRESLRSPQPEEYPPDPDVDLDDIDHYADPSGFHARFERNRSNDGADQQQGGLFGTMFGGLIRYMTQPQEPRQEQEYPPQGYRPDQGDTMIRRTVSPNGATTVTRQMNGGNGSSYSWSMTTTHSASGFPGLQPRDAHRPQQMQQPQDLNAMLDALVDTLTLPPGMQSPFRHTGPLPLDIFQPFLGPMLGVRGDAVYSQEALDQVISQLMERNPTGSAPGPAPEQAINSLPQRAITKEDLGDSDTAECSICMDTAPLGDNVTVLPCSHWFHYDCIASWLREHDTCPHCRKGIIPRDANAGAARTSTEAPLNDMHSRAQVPGAYPSQSRGGSRRDPQSSGVFDRMREAFGGNNDASGSGSS